MEGAGSKNLYLQRDIKNCVCNLPRTTNIGHINNRKKILFSDECRIQRFGSDGREYIWRKINEPPSMRTVKSTVKKGGSSIIVWGCMSAKGVGHAARINGHNEQPVISSSVRR